LFFLLNNVKHIWQFWILYHLVNLPLIKFICSLKIKLFHRMFHQFKNMTLNYSIILIQHLHQPFPVWIKVCTVRRLNWISATCRKRCSTASFAPCIQRLKTLPLCNDLLNIFAHCPVYTYWSDYSYRWIIINTCKCQVSKYTSHSVL